MGLPHCPEVRILLILAAGWQTKQWGCAARASRLTVRPFVGGTGWVRTHLG